MQIRCNFPDISYLSERQKNNFQFLSKLARLWRHLFYDKRHFELSTGNVTMNVAMSFSLRFAEIMLKMS